MRYDKDYQIEHLLDDNSKLVSEDIIGLWRDFKYVWRY